MKLSISIILLFFSTILFAQPSQGSPIKGAAWNDINNIPSGFADGNDDNTNLTEAEVDVFVANNGYLTSEIDGSITNEIQNLSISSNTISLSGSGNTIDLSSYLDNTNLTEAEVDAFANNNGYLTSEIDGSITNEIQDLTLTNEIIGLTGGSTPTVDLSLYVMKEDIQRKKMSSALTINSTTLVNLPSVTLDIKTGETWFVEVFIQSEILNANADLRGAFICASCTGRMVFSNLENAVARSIAPNATSLNIPVATSTINSGDVIKFEGIIVGGADEAVSFQIRNNATTTAQTFSEFSYIIAHKID